jgi:hypothetical protein
MPGDIAMYHATAMSGPEFLEAVAHAERGNSNDINADIYEQRAAEWKLDKRAIETLQQDLQAAKDKLAGIATTLLGH